MRAIVMDRTGGPEVLREADVPRPVAGAGQVLVRTEAVGVGYYEVPLRSGVFRLPFALPTTFGCEAAGTVVELGEGADPGWLDRRVVLMDIAGMGTYAEFVAVGADALTAIPDGVSAVDAVAAAVPAAVALALWERATAAPGSRVLVQAAAGGVGGYLTQLGRAGGATVVATAGGAAKRARARALGADPTVDHTDPDWPDGVRAALDGAELESLVDTTMPLAAAADAHRRVESRLATGKIVLLP